MPSGLRRDFVNGSVDKLVAARPTLRPNKKFINRHSALWDHIHRANLSVFGT